MTRLASVAAFMFIATAANADLSEVRAAVEEGDGHAMILILMPEDMLAMTRIADGLTGVGDIRVGVGVYGGQLPEMVSARTETLELFAARGFTVCEMWGTESYDLSPTDIQNRFNVLWTRVFEGAGNAAILIDNGDMTTAGVEFGQDFVIPGAGTGDDRLFVDLEGSADEVRDDVLFSAVDLMIDGESRGQGADLDCMKAR